MQEAWCYVLDNCSSANSRGSFGRRYESCDAPPQSSGDEEEAYLRMQSQTMGEGGEGPAREHLASLDVKLSPASGCNCSGYQSPLGYGASCRGWEYEGRRRGANVPPPSPRSPRSRRRQCRRRRRAATTSPRAETERSRSQRSKDRAPAVQRRSSFNGWLRMPNVVPNVVLVARAAWSGRARRRSRRARCRSACCRRRERLPAAAVDDARPSLRGMVARRRR